MNIIFIVSDSFRYDNLQCYRPTATRTPNLDRFAAQSTVFTNAYLGSYPTVPNRLDTMTGRFSFLTHLWQPLPADAITLQDVLTASGFVTQLIADTPHLIGEGFNYSRGFSGWEWIRGQETDRWKTHPREVRLPSDPHKLRTPEIIKSHYRNTAWWRDEGDTFPARTIQSACQWLEDNQDSPQFFLWIDMFDPHEPWDPPEKYRQLYEAEYQGQEPNYPVYGRWRDFLTEEELNHIRALYRAESSLVDHWIGVLLEKIEALGMEEDTAVIFVSDHGFLFGEHGHVGKSYIQERDGRMTYESLPMYDELRRIPLMIRLPGQHSGQVKNALVQTPDLMPTILEMAGLLLTEAIGGEMKTQALQCGVFSTTDWSFHPDSIHGRSLMPLLRGEVDRHRDLVVCSSTLIQHTSVIAKSAIITEDGWCLHYSGAYDEQAGAGEMAGVDLIDPSHAVIPCTPTLYYLPEDPGEEHDCAPTHEALAREIHARYVRWLQDYDIPAEHLRGRLDFRLRGK